MRTKITGIKKYGTLNKMYSIQIVKKHVEFLWQPVEFSRRRTRLPSQTDILYLFHRNITLVFSILVLLCYRKSKMIFNDKFHSISENVVDKNSFSDMPINSRRRIYSKWTRQNYGKTMSGIGKYVEAQKVLRCLIWTEVSSKTGLLASKISPMFYFSSSMKRSRSSFST